MTISAGTCNSISCSTPLDIFMVIFSTMSAKKHPNLIIHSAVILLYLIKSLKSDTEDEILPTNVPIPQLDPFLEPYKNTILNTINTIRDLHEVPKLYLNAEMSNWGDVIAQGIMRRETNHSYVPGEVGEENLPEAYFQLVNRMQLKNITQYANDRRYNPILLWYASRKNYPGHYDKKLHTKYGFYTQLIWKDSQKVGIGLAYQRLSWGDLEIVLHISFIPNGNNPDTWDANVLPAQHPIPPELDPGN